MGRRRDDARPAGAAAKGYLSLDFNQVGTDFPIIKDILKHVVDAGKSQTQKDRAGENLYNRGILNSMIIAEGIRNAQKISGKQQITGEEHAPRSRDAEHFSGGLKEMGVTGSPRR